MGQQIPILEHQLLLIQAVAVAVAQALQQMGLAAPVL
jgi:hypothetical protein